MYDFGKLLYLMKQKEPSSEEKEKLCSMTNKERLDWKCKRLNAQLSSNENGRYVVANRNGQLVIEWKGE